ncbi:RNA polymerase sigma factor [Planotetraspora kaengkrachanensis]|uniref:RNA polymerase sigma factor n=1 Tax=Planotetraspora kaengkrachanensis TaxID=575193 RepID=A0A8J3PRU1_9ACTN|nr:RNA polymerase sigma factor [Planotetraspora kaengkrachanensis]GIG77531.1 RNA polymerase sigma factor [Planotetraspora kaengkrachanensis]
MTDELLVVRCQLGERAAFAELVQAWHVPVWRYVRRMLDADRADDVTQEIWLAVIGGLPRLADPGRFTPWLFTIARRAVTNRLREEYARAETSSNEETAAEDSIAALVDRAELMAGLSGVPVLEREILVLFYLEDLSIEDCAEICGIPTGTVKSRLNRARRLLREHLTERGFQR